jgi:hypothetical protein
MRRISASVEKTHMQNQQSVKKLNYNYQTLIDVERQKITEIKVAQKSVTNAKEGEKEKLKLVTNDIVTLIENLIVQKSLHIAELKNLIIKWQPKQVTLLGLPFYFVGHKSGSKFICSVYPPYRVMNGEGIIKKIEKALLSFSLESRIKILLQPRSKKLSKIFITMMKEKIKTDRIFEKNLRDLAVSNNLLADPNFKEALNEGLEGLKTEGWIKSDENTILVKKYA